MRSRQDLQRIAGRSLPNAVMPFLTTVLLEFRGSIGALSGRVSGLKLVGRPDEDRCTEHTDVALEAVMMSRHRSGTTGLR